MLMYIALALLAVMLLAGCASWSGPADLYFTDGSSRFCPGGLAFDSVAVNCRGLSWRDDSRFPWHGVKGFGTRR